MDKLTATAKPPLTRVGREPDDKVISAIWIHDGKLNLWEVAVLSETMRNGACMHLEGLLILMTEPMRDQQAGKPHGIACKMTSAYA